VATVAWLFSSERGPLTVYRIGAYLDFPPHQNDVGYAYYTGKGIEKDFSKAAYWYRKAAEAGWVTSQSNLCMMYIHGEGVPQDYAEAVNWCSKAAEQGFAKAQHNLGVMLVNGLGTEQDEPKGVQFITNAAQQGYGLAQQTLAIYLLQGQGVAQDRVRAYAWLSLASKQPASCKGDVVAQLDALAQNLSNSEIEKAKILVPTLVQPGKYEPTDQTECESEYFPDLQESKHFKRPN
jgi:TPR repeat protein